jgi:hypothetical protein
MERAVRSDQSPSELPACSARPAPMPSLPRCFSRGVRPQQSKNLRSRQKAGPGHVHIQPTVHGRNIGKSRRGPRFVVGEVFGLVLHSRMDVTPRQVFRLRQFVRTDAVQRVRTGQDRRTANFREPSECDWTLWGGVTVTSDIFIGGRTAPSALSVRTLASVSTQFTIETAGKLVYDRVRVKSTCQCWKLRHS